MRKRVWELVFMGQERLAEGFTCMTVKKDGVAYFYNLWFEDGEGNMYAQANQRECVLTLSLQFAT